MGGHSSKISKQDIEVYQQLTFFTEKQILNCFKRCIIKQPALMIRIGLFCRFVKLVGDDVLQVVDSINDERCKVKFDLVVTTLSELKVNPFAYRLCEVFAQSEQAIMFEEFLDLMSVLSEAAPPQVGLMT